MTEAEYEALFDAIDLASKILQRRSNNAMASALRQALEEDESIYPRVKVTGVDGHECAGLHFDTNGAWGGHRAVMAHFRPEESVADLAASDDVIYLYTLVGPYWTVGKDPLSERMSAWDAAQLFTEALESGVDPAKLHDAIKGVMQRSR